MGCSSSKTAQSAGAPSDAPAETDAPVWRTSAQTQTPLPIPEGDFKVNLENVTGSAGLGMTVNCPEKRYMVVETVKEEGLIPSWNKATENTPEMKVNVGDIIVVVNGVFGDSDLMRAEVKSKTITLTVKRRQPASGEPAAEVTAAETPVAAAPAAEAAAAEAPAATAPALDAPAAEAPLLENPAAEAPAGASPVAENPVQEAPAAAAATDAAPVEAPVAEAVAATNATGVEAPVEEAAAATDAAPVEAPAADAASADAVPELLDGVVVVAEGVDVDADVKEEQLCKLAMC